MVSARSGPGRCRSGVLFPSGCAGALPPAPLRGSGWCEGGYRYRLRERNRCSGAGLRSAVGARGGTRRGSRISKSSCRPALRRKNGCGVRLRTARAVRCRGRSRDWSEPELGPGPEEGPIRWFGRSGRSVAPLRMRTAKRPTLGRRIGRLVRRNDGRYLAVMVCPLIST